MKKKEWFRIKKYPHIGLPLTKNDKSWVSKYVKNPTKITNHPFLPFIHRKNEVSKYRKIDLPTGFRSKNRYVDKKERELFYANHLDAQIFSYYAHILTSFYEDKLKDKQLEDCVTAYRQIKITPLEEHSICKSNSDFAADIFNFILKSKSQSLIAITFDIKSFFDSISHKKLKKSWYTILDKKTLDDDHYNVFKNITNFSFVNENELFKEFKDNLIVETKSGIRKKRKVKKIRYLKNHKIIAYCTANEFKTRILNKGLLVKNDYTDPSLKTLRTKGIPQGSPISSVLANIYMLNFDLNIQNYVNSIEGIYRRYSDDMVVICPENYEKDIIGLFHEEIKERDLCIQDKKTQIFQFTKTDGRFYCAKRHEDLLLPHRNFEYLGFEFDGYHSFIKSASLAGYYRKMKRAVNRGKYYSIIDIENKGIFKSRLYRKFTYKGAKRKRVYIRDPANQNIWIKTERHDWGNFVSYARLAKSKLPHNKIKGQIKRHWNILNKLIN